MSGNRPGWSSDARGRWLHTGAERPSFAIEPGPGQESVWDYPRPPAIVSDVRPVVVGDPRDPLARTVAARRVLETASPPTFYIPSSDVRTDRLVAVRGHSVCEWKGIARYWALAAAPDTPIGWDYPEPHPEFAVLVDHIAFYPGRIHCAVAGETVRPQAGNFYGGWITGDVVGTHEW